MSRVLALLLLILAVMAAPAHAQSVQGQIQPLNVEPDINGVNLTTGQARRRVPVLEIPGAPNLRLERIADLVPVLRGTVTLGPELPPGAGSYSLNRGGLTSIRFTCGEVCVSEEGMGSTLVSSYRFQGGLPVGFGSYVEGHSGKQILFNILIDGSVASGDIAYYANWMAFPSGERLDFTYQTLTSGSNRVVRPTQVASNLGYVMTLTYQSNDIFNPGVQILSQATIYAAADMTTPLARHSYSGDNVTDLAGRTWSCCADMLNSPPEASTMDARLPGMNVDSFVAESEARTYNGVTVDDWITEYTSDGVVYEYSYEAIDFVQNPTESDMYIDEVTITGPEGFELTADITVDYEPAPGRGDSVITRVTNALGQQTDYLYDSPANRLIRITYPEDNAVSVSYDGNGNITHRRVHAKPGSSQPDLVEQAGYTASVNCSDTSTRPITCFRPDWTEDEADNRTDYTWTTRGELATMLEPVDANGRRRKTINTWTAHTTAAGTIIHRLTRQRICSELANGTNVDCGTAAEQRTNTTYWEDTFLPLSLSAQTASTRSRQQRPTPMMTLAGCFPKTVRSPARATRPIIATIFRAAALGRSARSARSRLIAQRCARRGARRTTSHCWLSPGGSTAPMLRL